MRKENPHLMTTPATDTRYRIKPAWPLLFVILIAGLFLGYLTEGWVGEKPSPDCFIRDELQMWLAPLNSYVAANESLSNILMILYSIVGDAAVLILVAFSVIRTSIRPIFPLLVFMVIRQIMQLLVSFPLDPNLIWHYPGFPSLFADYQVSGDFFFSGYVGINILAALEFREIFRLRWLTVVNFLVIIFVIVTDLILRSHYTTDIYTSIITAIFAYLFTQQFIPSVDRYLKKLDKFSHFLLIFVICVAIASIFVIQYFIGKKEVISCGISDLIQQLFFPFNAYLRSHVNLGNAFLITMNFLLDCMFVFMFVDTIITRNIRPFLTYAIFFILRQSMQMAISLPLPPDPIWHYPGFPSLIQNYQIVNDLYFSGHAGISLIAALEMSSFSKRWLTILGFSIFVFESTAVIAMQIHYTMDVFTAIMTVFCITDLSCHLAHPINNALARLMRSQ